MRKLAFVIVCLLALPAAGQPWDGNGVEGDPYLIWDANQLNAIGANPGHWDKHFKLMMDIDLSCYTGTQFNMIGYYESGNINKPFTGVFNGNGHTISNFTYISSGIDWIGLFGYVYGPDAEIKNVKLINPNINGGTGRWIGSLVGYLGEGKITDCYVEAGSVTGEDYCVGGLVAYSRGIITNCHSSNSVVGESLAGGLVGINANLLSNCYSNSDVKATWNGAGGLAGKNSSQGIIKVCYSTGNISGIETVGGLVGSNDWAYIYGCYSEANVSGDKTIGGLVGHNGGGGVKSTTAIQLGMLKGLNLLVG